MVDASPTWRVVIFNRGYTVAYGILALALVCKFSFQCAIRSFLDPHLPITLL